MNDSSAQGTPASVYRLDRFVVPAAARAEFVSRILETHAFLRQQPVFVRDLLLEKSESPASTTIVTVAIWKDAQAVESAKGAVNAWRRQTGFDPAQLIRTLGIEADLGVYHDLT